MIVAGVIREDEKFELVEGDIVMMAAKGIAHERIKSALTVAISRVLPDDLTIGVEATLRLADKTMLEPDVAVFSKNVFKKSTTFAQLDPGEAHLVIEVAASSLAYDKALKARLYARHGVKEFWVIDANTRVTWMHTSAADLKFLHHLPQTRPGTSNRKAALAHKLASAPLLSKFVSGRAAMYHELRKRGTGPSGDAWSSMTERGPQDALTTPALPGFSLRLGEIEP